MTCLAPGAFVDVLQREVGSGEWKSLAPRVCSSLLKPAPGGWTSFGGG